MAVPGLRVVAAATFLPAFPLLLAHGVVSGSAVPAVGLVPLACSSSVSLYIVLRRLKQRRARAQDDEEEAPAPAPAAPASADAPPEEPADEEEEPQLHSSVHSDHSILVFFIDVILAGALLTVLLFSWMAAADFDGQSATLAAYGTMPLLTNFLIHLHFAVRAFSTGLALHDLIQWLAWQVVPADCPDCGHRLRPSSAPTVPWLETARRVRLPAVPSSVSANAGDGRPRAFRWRTVREVRLPRVAVPSVAEWRAPAWLPRPGSWNLRRSNNYGAADVDDGETRPLFADNDPDAARYRDDPAVADPDHDSLAARVAGDEAASYRVPEPDEVPVISGRKSRKNSSQPTSNKDGSNNNNGNTTTGNNNEWA